MKKFLLITCLLACITYADTHSQSKPNIIYILTDDLGYGDVKVYNKEGKINTPNIDKLAKQGMRFTDAHSPSGVCTPTRYYNFAMNFEGAIPTEQVMPSWASTFARIAAAISRPVPNNFLAPVTSRKASSTDTGSTLGVKLSKISMM